MTHAPAPNPNSFKLRLRSRKAQDGSSDGASAPSIPRKKIVKRSAPPRGINKRRREAGDSAGRSDEDATDVQNGTHESAEEKDTGMAGPSTPKRQRLIAPEILPLGLERADFRTLRLNLASPDEPKSSTGEESTDAQAENRHNHALLEDLESSHKEEEGQDDEWTSEEDRMLVELVLEKLRLSKSDWKDCARSLGKDRGSVGKRWKSLMVGGEVGLKGRGRSGGRDRGRICNTWR